MDLPAAFDHTLWTVLLGSALIGLVSGALGVFALLRKQSLLGDTISHAALPGVALGFLVFRAQHPLPLIAGAMAAGWLGTLAVLAVVRGSRIKEDAAMGMVLSVFFGLGLTLLTFIQKLETANQAGLTKFLFGSAATMLTQDVVLIAVFGLCALALLLLLWKEFKLSTFDPGFTESIGFPVYVLDVLLLSLMVVAITIGLESVGVVLMSAMLVAPAAAARQWTDRLDRMAILSALFGAAAGAGGAFLSSAIPRLPTGPTTVLLISGLAGFSILFAGERGIVRQALRRRKDQGEIAQARVLEQLLLLSRQHASAAHPHERQALQALFHERIDGYLEVLRERGLITLTPDGLVALTGKGHAAAEKYARGEPGRGDRPE